MDPSGIKRHAGVIAAVALLLLLAGCDRNTLQGVSFSQSAAVISAYDFVEVAVGTRGQTVRNPFLDAKLTGTFQTSDGKHSWDVGGFCDSTTGDRFAIRFMPPAAGDYRYRVEYRQGGESAIYSGTFRVKDDHKRGVLRTDQQYPWHFVWEGTGVHYFFNGTTAYWLLGWSDERVAYSIIDRLQRLKVNRIRITIAGRTNEFYGEPVIVGKNWTVFLTPWPARSPQDVYQPGFDYTRFDVGFWQKVDRVVRYAREKDVIVSLVLDMDNSITHPVADSADEQRFIRYAVARLSAFSNVTWDLGDDLDKYRNMSWSRRTGELIERLDPYHHLATSHPVNFVNQDLAADWLGFTSYQEWSRNQHTFMLDRRKRQEASGRIIPQTNEEYGYEDHYPLWAKGPGSDSADTLRRTAWDISMAGAYQTAGESARRGTNVWPDTGGGWMNGRGDDTMTMLQGYAHMVDFFTSFEWWKTNPHDELVTAGSYCLAKPGEFYAVYLPHGGKAILRLSHDSFHGFLFDPSTGDRTAIGPISGPTWTIPVLPITQDWAILLEKN